MYRANYIGYVDDVEILFWARLAGSWIGPWSSWAAREG